MSSTEKQNTTERERERQCRGPFFFWSLTYSPNLSSKKCVQQTMGTPRRTLSRGSTRRNWNSSTPSKTPARPFTGNKWSDSDEQYMMYISVLSRRAPWVRVKPKLRNFRIYLIIITDQPTNRTNIKMSLLGLRLILINQGNVLSVYDSSCHYCTIVVQSGASYLSQGFGDNVLGSSPGWLADTVATYCPGSSVRPNIVSAE